MDLTSPAIVFEIANQLALPGWIWLILWLWLPERVRHATRYVGLALPLIQATIYAAAALVNFSSAEGSFTSLDGVLSLFEHPGSTLAGWVHYLSFDLLVGWCITRHAVNARISRVLVIPSLLLTFMLGPVGLLLYFVVYVSSHLIKHVVKSSNASDALRRQILGGQLSLAQCGVFLLLLTPVLILAMTMDSRAVLEINVWVKPLKFALALVIYTLTLSWYSNYLPEHWRSNRWFNGYSQIVVVAILLEMLWLIYAASIGEPSHFNQTHPILSPVYSLMGVLAVILTTQSLITGVGLLRYRSDNLSEVTRYTLAFGLIATFILTVVTAGYLSSHPAQSHAVLPQTMTSFSERNAIPLMGWLREAGDLRVAHFFATHSLHFIPLFGLLIGRLFLKRSGTAAAQSVRVASMITAIYTAGVLFVFIQAINGKPFL